MNVNGMNVESNGMSMVFYDQNGMHVESNCMNKNSFGIDLYTFIHILSSPSSSIERNWRVYENNVRKRNT